MTAVIDLNADLGEGAGHDDEILDLVSSANISCGFHAGNPASVLASIRAAKEKKVAVGAHPSFDDRVNFGRTEMHLPAGDVFALVAYQLGGFQAMCTAAGVEMNHVKPHGALYNMAAADPALAEAIAHALLAVDKRLLLFVPPQSCLEKTALELEIDSITEFFADRNYMPDGSLVPRSRPDALIDDPLEAADRVLRVLNERMVEAIDGTAVPMLPNTICVHGDTPDAVSFIRELRRRLELEDVMIAAPGKRV